MNKNRRQNILFIYYIKKEKIQDFYGFVFEEDFIAKDVIDYDYDYLKFKECIFYKTIDFSDFVFKGKVLFLNCKFLEGVFFYNSIIYKNFTIKECYFNEKIINIHIFKDSKVNNQSMIIFKNTNLPRMDGIVFSKESKFLLKDCHYNKKYSYIGKINYTIAQLQAQNIHDDKNLGYYTYYERKYSSNSMNKDDFSNYAEYLLSKILNYISRELMGYGEHISKLFFFIFFIIALFAFLYMIIGVTTSSGDIIKVENINEFSGFELFKTYIDFWYFSIITFTTVGFGDMTVNGVIGKLLVCLEVFIGITIQSIWVALIIKRMFK